jgi:putative endopeptidase
MKLLPLFATCAGLAILVSTAHSEDAVPPLTARELVFSVDNMDRTVDPRKDFHRYASGTWLKTAVRPERLPSISPFDYMGEHLNAQMKVALARVAAEAPKAQKGSTAQQVGDFFAAFMDQARIDSLGMAPIQPELDRIAAISNLAEFAGYVGRYEIITGDFILLAAGPGPDRVDNSKMVTAVAPGALALEYPVVYSSPDGTPVREAYRAGIRDSLIIAGFEPKRAQTIADTFLRIETAVFEAQLSPTEKADPHNTYHPMALADLQASLPGFDLAAMFLSLGVAAPDEVILMNARYPQALKQILTDNSLDDLKDYATWAVIRKFLSVLPSKMNEAWKPFNQALYGSTEISPRDEAAIYIMRKNMGHPLSKVYVDNFFSADTRDKASEMIGRIKAVFMERLQANAWLTKPTLAQAQDKLEKLSFAVGFPDKWIDYSMVDIRRDDAFGNLLRLQEAVNQKEQQSISKPPHRDGFANSDATLPIIINAAYNPQINGFEVPAAILQPPAFEPEQDAAVRYCKLGAVIGHEMTHGFDSNGRNFDAKGNMRDWWTAGDTAAFQREADKLIAQANAFEVLPGLALNGAQTVTENMADAGGITLAYEALQHYLAEHPEENKPIDGLTPDQRCFIAWAQLWTSVDAEQLLRRTVAADNHPPNPYRVTAPLQHVDGFYAAFGIKEGDPMWLAPEKRIKAW